MIKIRAKQDTYLKKSTKQSSELPDNEKSLVPKGKEYSVETYSDASDGHIKVDLAFGAGTWFVFKEDWEGFPSAAGEVPEPGIELIKKFEGVETSAYPDPRTGGEPWTIGYGTTVYADGRKVKRGDTITLEQAEYELMENCKRKYLPPLKKIPYYDEMDQYQRGALLSFGYNLGANFYGASGFNTITTYLRDKRWSQMRSAFILYINPGSSVEAGLRRRRNKEADVWFTNIQEA